MFLNHRRIYFSRQRRFQKFLWYYSDAECTFIEYSWRQMATDLAVAKTLKFFQWFLTNPGALQRWTESKHCLFFILLQVPGKTDRTDQSALDCRIAWSCILLCI